MGDKHPKDMTQAEFDALPIGPFVRKHRNWTPEEIAAGVARGFQKEWAEAPEVKASYLAPGDPLYYEGGDGRKYMVGQWKNGGWFRSPLPL